MADVIFLLFALGTLAGGAVVAFSRNIVHSAFGLLLAFFCVAGLYVFLDADFIAAAQVVVYIGGILVLILFGVMLTERIDQINLSNAALKPTRGWLLLLAVLAVLATAIAREKWLRLPGGEAVPTTGRLGDLFLSKYLLPFEVASLLLVVALVGAILVGRKEVRDE